VVREQAQVAIRNIGTKAVPLLREMLHARDSFFKTNLVNLLSQQSFVKFNITMARERRIQAGLACIELGPKGPAIQNLLEFTKGGSFCANVGEAALGRIGAEAVGPLCLALTDDDPKTRQVAAGALGNIGTKAEKAIPELTKHLRDEYGGVRAMAARALGRVGVVLPEVVRALVEALGDADPRVRSNADVALTSFGVKAVPMLQTLLEEHDPDLREGARKVIDEIEKMKEPPRTAIPFRQIL